MPAKLKDLQEAIRGECLDGWLFCNFRHRDTLSDEILGIAPDTVNSRLWIYAVPAEGDSPRKIIHAVEPLALEGLPGDEQRYVSREELASALKGLGGKSWGVHLSENLPAISYMDGGTAALLEKAGLRLVPAEGLVQRLRGLLDGPGIASHERAAVHLYEIVELTWEAAKKAHRNRTLLREGELRALMLEEITRRGLITEHGLIVAAGPNAGNPHYGFDGGGAEIRDGDVVQLDLWARENRPGAVYADISWVGFFGEKPPPETEKRFADLIRAREEALAFIREAYAAGRNPSGAMVDKKAREILIRAGYEPFLKHRTGHGIDTELHGSGVNMDSVEFPDKRPLLEGSCFSLEPGIYFEAYGLRTEIDVYIREGKPVVSGSPHRRQFALLTC